MCLSMDITGYGLFTRYQLEGSAVDGNGSLRTWIVGFSEVPPEAKSIAFNGIVSFHFDRKDVQ